MKPDSASNVRDAARVAAVRRLDLLDTPAEEAFDRLTRMAAKNLKAPVALVTLVDEDRQFFKSRHGLPETWRTRLEHALPDSFCRHVVAKNEPLVIRDAHKHPLMRDKLPATELGATAYLGIPLVTPDGYVAGSFCVIDSKPRNWSKRDIGIMSDLAALVMTEIALRSEIKARKQAEEALQKAHDEVATRLDQRVAEIQRRDARMKWFADSNLMGVKISDLHGRITEANDSFLRIVGYTREDLAAGKLNWAQMTPPEWSQADEIAKQNILATGVTPPWEKEYIRKDGSRVSVLVGAAMLEGSKEQAVGFVIDISERKRAEAALKESEERYRALFEADPDALLLVDRETKQIINTNDAAARLYGYNRDELEKLDVFSIFAQPEEAVAFVRAATAEPAATLPVREHKRKDGSIFPAEISARGFDLHGRKMMYAAIRDMTERTRLDEKLRESEKFYRTLIETVPVGIVLTDENAKISFLSQKALEMFAIPDGEGLGTTAEKWLAPEHHETARHRIGQIIHELRAQPPIEYALVRHDGTSFWGELTSAPLLNAQGGLKGILVAIQDITERQRAEYTVRKEKELSQRVIDSLPGIFYLLDDAQRMLLWNKNLEKVTGSTPEQVAQTGPLDRVADEDKALVAQRMSEAFESGAADAEVTIVSRDGKRTPFYVTGKRIVLDGGPCVVGMGIEITRLKEAEQRLNQSREQLRALAAHLQTVREEERTRIAREIHDVLGQAMTGVKIDLAWLEKKIPAGQTALLERIRDISELVNPTIETLRNICAELRPGVLDDLGLAAAIEWQAAEFARRTGIATAVAANPHGLTLDDERSTALFRIFQEALTNVARHSGATKVDVEIAERDGCVELIVHDNGRGITGLELSNGGSLGLLGMRERAHVFGGDVTIRGAPGGGTIVKATVPLAQAARGPVREVAALHATTGSAG
jgi:PAS domain S-box-containing protein